MGLLGVLPLLLMVVALVDIITRPEAGVQHMPKLVWLLVVLLVPLIGSVLWFVMGHRWERTGGGNGHATARRVMTTAAPRTASPRKRTTEEQLADLEREIKYYEDQDRIKHLEEEIKKRRDPGD